MDKAEIGTIAICSNGSLGLITDINDGLCKGIHLTNAISKIGAPWQSSSPIIVASMSKMLMASVVGLLIQRNKNIHLPNTQSPEEEHKIKSAIAKLKELTDD